MTTSPGMSSEHLSIAHHPDIQDLGQRRLSRTSPTAAGFATLALLAGVYAAISPWVVGFHAQAAFGVTDLIVGLAIAYVAYTVVRENSGFLMGAAGLMGVWLIVAPFVVQDTDRTVGLVTSNIITGAVVVALSLATGAAFAVSGRHSVTS